MKRTQTLTVIIKIVLVIIFIYVAVNGLVVPSLNLRGPQRGYTAARRIGRMSGSVRRTPSPTVNQIRTPMSVEVLNVVGPYYGSPAARTVGLQRTSVKKDLTIQRVLISNTQLLQLCF